MQGDMELVLKDHKGITQHTWYMSDINTDEDLVAWLRSEADELEQGNVDPILTGSE